MAVVMLIFSILMILGGISCMAMPVSAFSTLGWLAGIAVLVVGVFSIFRYAAGHNGRSVWELVGGICGVLFGFFMIVNNFAQAVTNIILAYIAAVWLLVHGACGIIEAVKLKRINGLLPDIARSSVWLVVLISGILTVVMGIACIIQPIISMISIGMLIGISILISGIRSLVYAVWALQNK